VIRQRFEQNLNSERQWFEGVGRLFSLEPKHYIRLNPLFERMPDLDDTKALGDDGLEKTISNFLNEPNTIATINQVARRLIATSFYLEPPAPGSAAGDGTTEFYGMDPFILERDPRS
jgi:hypothetical protein